ncbi:hypothetical protein LWC34_49765 [Kibdelosporangium philippinense]|uniref:Uncharacterized protein n=1 Tax=Kibdelosporangium philippinense TaxID=211113 RepID=A0ABS8ZV27_9PSEU|nr:hypothetical protein [Kibdelosporangium philippinense]MCE7010840.1 hypothetical protein [Kibdelosporangium philippinense]
MARPNRLLPATMPDVAVGLLTDPGLAAELVDRLHGDLSERLGARVDVVHDPFEAMYPDISLLMEKAREHVRGTVWDLVICVTDQPMPGDSGVAMAGLHTADRVAVISLPALGWFHRRRLRASIVEIVGYFVSCETPAMPVPTTSVRRSESHVDVVLPRRWAVLQAVIGMVRVNRPWRLFRGLSRALAGALTGMTFGVLYSTIWTLAAVLSPARLAAATVAGIAILTVWIIVGHELWESAPQTRLRNISTVVTVAVGAFAFFVALFAIALGVMALVIPPGYLAGVLGHPVGLSDYVTIALMASVIGTLAGAVGSGLENDTTVREATYGHRARQRRSRVEHEAEDGTTPTLRYRKD